MGRRQPSVICYPDELVWAIHYVINYLGEKDTKEEWLETLSRDHLWHPLRYLIDWLQGENVPDETEAAKLMLTAAKDSEENEITFGNLTADELFERRVKIAVAERIAAIEHNEWVAKQKATQTEPAEIPAE
jgi:hypothetical protein